MSTRSIGAVAILAALLPAGSAVFAEVGAGGADVPAARPVTTGQWSASKESDWLTMGVELARQRPTSQPGGAAGEGAPRLGPEVPATETPRMVPWVDYRGDLWHRAALTGDWGGLRQKMMDKGLRANVSLTQILQGNIDGGVSRRSWYMGLLRYELDLDTGAAGLWPGGLFHVRGETQYGKNDLFDSGALLPVNSAALYPVPDQETRLSEAYYTQFVAPWLGFIAGKMSPRENNVFARDETTQFMNMAFFCDPVIGTTVPLDFLGAGVILAPAKWFTLTTLVLDSEGTANVSGFDTVFDRGTSVFQTAEVAIRPFGQQGHQRVGWSWSDKSQIQLSQDVRLIIRQLVLKKLGLGPGPTLKRQGSDWSFLYDFDQYLYTKPGTKNQGVGLFGRFGYSDGTVNPVGQFYSLGIGGKGMIPGRDSDTFGIGYYYLAVSHEMGPILRKLVADEKGVELYYNIEVTPWLHITPDLQIIWPGQRMLSDTSVVAGIRVRMDF